VSAVGKTLSVAIAAGGTAGHINPALALAEELRTRGHEVAFFGQSRRLEGTLVPQAGFGLTSLDVTGFDRSKPWTLLSALWRMRKAERHLTRHFAEVGTPDVAVGFGAYIELPLMRWCANNVKVEPAPNGNFKYGKIAPHSRKTDVFMAFVAAFSAREYLPEPVKLVFAAPVFF
jgi:hypothetical protein